MYEITTIYADGTSEKYTTNSTRLALGQLGAVFLGFMELRPRSRALPSLVKSITIIYK